MQAIRDRILAELAQNFSAEQLQMIDLAVATALKGYRVEPEETLPEVRQNVVPPEVYEYLARKKSKGLDKGTLAQYEYVLRCFFIYSRKAPDDVRDYDVLKFLDDYETIRGIKRRRKDGMRVILNTFFRYMVDTGKIRMNPMATVECIRFEKRVRQALTDLEFERLKRGCRTVRDRALLEFFFATGCRVSEVVGANRSDIDFENRQLKVFGKGKKERIVFLNAGAVIWLDEYFRTREDRSDALFVSDRRPHQRLKKNALEKIIKDIGRAAGLSRRVYPHLLRHTTATFLLRHGMLLDQVQDYLGHESVDTTRIYAKSDPEELKGAYRRCMAA